MATRPSLAASPVFNIINYNAKEYDSGSLVAPGNNWKFTAPVAGVYLIDARTTVSNTVSGPAPTFSAFLSLFRNDGEHRRGTITYATSNDIALQLNTAISLNAGDRLDVRLYITAGSFKLDGAYVNNYVSIVRMPGS